jgi:hypothetical protein
LFVQRRLQQQRVGHVERLEGAVVLRVQAGDVETGIARTAWKFERSTDDLRGRNDLRV